MRRALLLFLTTACSGDEGSPAGPPPPTDPAALERTVRDLAAFGEKRVGTAGGAAAASYLREWGDTQFRAFKLDVVRFVDGEVAEVTTFGSGLFPRFGLPPTLDDPGEPGEAHGTG